MAGFDGTGPFGTGPVGRGMGPCGGGQAFGRGRFFRRSGFGWGYPGSNFSPDDEKKALENRKNLLESELDTISKRISDLQK